MIIFLLFLILLAILACSEGGRAVLRIGFVLGCVCTLLFIIAMAAGGPTP